ncbi:hypothetical protein CALVIDRAFT_556547 [Calocera viscosa TUFC12733]|uniref:Mid2 domain-containing protein n=1 Tax=Calocera viscosa (strain TUFC12733) TaxID=1330018 RepID=A0A167K5F5_CALVF|nr:hypothetical protein CALVIDRAFT_556547 [Calocera viscosa TUFC12733]
MSQQTAVNTTFPSSADGIEYAPADAWGAISAPGATDGQAEFDLTDSAHGYGDSFITWTFPQPATGLEYWGYQRSDGGLFSICFDCPPTSTLGDRIDALNASTNGTEPPRLLYFKYDLTYAIHNLTIANLFDQRATILGSTSGGYGQITLDRFVLEAPLNPPATSTPSPPSSTTATNLASSDSSSASSAAGLGANSSPASSNHTAAIVGGVIGGVAAILLAILCVLLYRLLQRRRQAQGPETHEFMLKNEPTSVHPFILDGGMYQGQTASQPFYAATVPGSISSPSVGTVSVHGFGSSPYVPVWSEVPAVQAAGSQEVPPSAGPVSRATSQGVPSVYGPISESQPTSGHPSMMPRTDQDAGFLRQYELDEVASTLPPDYDTATARRHLEGRV